jgi:hypothetical protein
MTEHTAEFYRREAHRMLSEITALTDANQQTELLQMARLYMKLADRAASDTSGARNTSDFPGGFAAA